MSINNHIPSQHQVKEYFNNFHKGADTEAGNHLKGSFRGRVVALLRQAEAKHDNTVATVRKLREDVRSFVSELRKTSPLSRLQEKSFKIISLPSSRPKSIESLSAFIKESRKKLDDKFSFAPGGRVVTLLRQAEAKHDNTVATVRKLREDVRSFVNELKKTSPLSRLQEKNFEAVSSSSNRTKSIETLSRFIKAAFEMQKIEKVSTFLRPTDALASVEKATTRVQDYLERQHEGSDFGTKLCELVSKDSEVKNPSKDSEVKNPSKNPSDAIKYLSSKNNQMLEDKYIMNILNKMNKNINSTYDLIRNRGMNKTAYGTSIKLHRDLHDLFTSNLERQADKNGVFLNIGEMLQKYPEVSEGATKKALGTQIVHEIMHRLPTQRTELLEFVHEYLPPAGEGDSDAIALRKEQAAATLISKILAGKCDETTIGNHVVGKRSIDKLQALIDDGGYRSLLVSGSA